MRAARAHDFGIVFGGLSRAFVGAGDEELATFLTTAALLCASGADVAGFVRLTHRIPELPPADRAWPTPPALAASTHTFPPASAQDDPHNDPAPSLGTTRGPNARELQPVPTWPRKQPRRPDAVWPPPAPPGAAPPPVVNLHTMPSGPGDALPRVPPAPPERSRAGSDQSVGGSGAGPGAQCGGGGTQPEAEAVGETSLAHDVSTGAGPAAAAADALGRHVPPTGHGSGAPGPTAPCATQQSTDHTSGALSAPTEGAAGDAQRAHRTQALWQDDIWFDPAKHRIVTQRVPPSIAETAGPLPDLKHASDAALALAVGRWGERLVLSYLRSSHAHNPNVHIRWMNVDAESGEHYDLAVEDHADGSIVYVEVCLKLRVSVCVCVCVCVNS